MKLYFSTGACSLAPHIVLQELGAKFETEAVNLRTKETASGDYKKINPKGQVPALKLDNGELLTEGPVIMQYLADQNPEKGLMPKLGTWERYRAMEWFNFVSTELHKGFSPLFGAERLMATKESAEELKTAVRKGLQSKIAVLEEEFKKKPFILGQNFSAVDAYIFTILNWSSGTKVDISGFPNVLGFMERMKSRPGVQAAMKAEAQ